MRAAHKDSYETHLEASEKSTYEAGEVVQSAQRLPHDSIGQVVEGPKNERRGSRLRLVTNTESEAGSEDVKEAKKTYGQYAMTHYFLSHARRQLSFYALLLLQQEERSSIGLFPDQSLQPGHDRFLQSKRRIGTMPLHYSTSKDFESTEEAERSPPEG